MAERRMFAKTIIDSDAFLDMPLSTQALYFHLSMRADDDGFVNNPKKIARMIGADEDSLKLLILKHFILAFDSGVIVIKHWRINNYLQRDRYKETVYQEEKSALSVKENGSYTMSETPCIHDGYRLDTTCIHDVSIPDTQDRLGKDRIDKDSIGEVSVEEPADKPQSRKRFVPPSVEEVAEYCRERGNKVDPQRFVDYYTANGWKVGRNPMKDWRATVRTWEKSDRPQSSQKPSRRFSSEMSSIDPHDLEALINNF